MAAAPPPKKLTMSFGKKDLPPPMNSSGGDISQIARRLVLLEERYDRVERNLQSMENHIHLISRDFNQVIAKMKSDLSENNAQVQQMQERMMMFLKELDLLAKQEDLDVVKKYLQYWDLAKFAQVTHVEKIVKDTLSEMGIFEKH